MPPIGALKRHVGKRRAGDEILALRQHQIGAVDLEERFAALHRLAGRVDVKFFDPALEFWIDNADAALVGRHGADRAHRMRHVAASDGFGAHAEHLNAFGADLDDAGLTGGVGIDRDVVHAHGILFRHRRRVRQAHGIAVIEDFPLAAWRCRSGRGGSVRRRRCRVVVDRDIVTTGDVFLRRWRIIGFSGRVLVIERLPFRRRGRPIELVGTGQYGCGQQ
jgi:hypothetical protein